MCVCACVCVCVCVCVCIHTYIKPGHFAAQQKLAQQCKSTILFFFGLFRVVPTAYQSSQSRGQIRAIADSLCHSHSKAGSKPHLQPTQQLTATPDP